MKRTWKEECELQEKRGKIINICYVIFVTIVLTFILVVNVKTYNKGICPNCHVKYEESHFILKGTSFTEFTCPDCHKSCVIRDIDR